MNDNIKINKYLKDILPNLIDYLNDIEKSSILTGSLENNKNNQNKNNNNLFHIKNKIEPNFENKLDKSNEILEELFQINNNEMEKEIKIYNNLLKNLKKENIELKNKLNRIENIKNENFEDNENLIEDEKKNYFSNNDNLNNKNIMEEIYFSKELYDSTKLKTEHQLKQIQDYQNLNLQLEKELNELEIKENNEKKNLLIEKIEQENYKEKNEELKEKINKEKNEFLDKILEQKKNIENLENELNNYNNQIDEIKMKMIKKSYTMKQRKYSFSSSNNNSISINNIKYNTTTSYLNNSNSNFSRMIDKNKSQKNILKHSFSIESHTKRKPFNNFNFI